MDTFALRPGDLVDWIVYMRPPGLAVHERSRDEPCKNVHGAKGEVLRGPASLEEGDEGASDSI